jgi:hypothetical protein
LLDGVRHAIAIVPIFYRVTAQLSAAVASSQKLILPASG